MSLLVETEYYSVYDRDSFLEIELKELTDPDFPYYTYHEILIDELREILFKQYITQNKCKVIIKASYTLYLLREPILSFTQSVNMKLFKHFSNSNLVLVLNEPLLDYYNRNKLYLVYHICSDYQEAVELIKTTKLKLSEIENNK